MFGSLGSLGKNAETRQLPQAVAKSPNFSTNFNTNSCQVASSKLLPIGSGNTCLH